MKMPSLIVPVALLCGAAFTEGCSRPVNIKNPRLQNVRGVLFHRGLPFNGETISRYRNGKVKARVPYKHGAKHGTARTWYANGQLSTERLYVMGKREGRHRGWHANGRVQFYSNFQDGKFHGESWSWFDDGGISTYFHVQDGRYLGYKKWRRSGKIFINYVVDDIKRIGVYGGRLCNEVKGDGKGKTLAY